MSLKKLLGLILCLVMVLGMLSGCGDKDGKASEGVTSDGNGETVEETTTPYMPLLQGEEIVLQDEKTTLDEDGYTFEYLGNLDTEKALSYTEDLDKDDKGDNYQEYNYTYAMLGGEGALSHLSETYYYGNYGTEKCPYASVTKQYNSSTGSEQPDDVTFKIISNESEETLDGVMGKVMDDIGFTDEIKENLLKGNRITLQNGKCDVSYSFNLLKESDDDGAKKYTLYMSADVNPNYEEQEDGRFYKCFSVPVGMDKYLDKAMELFDEYYPNNKLDFKLGKKGLTSKAIDSMVADNGIVGGYLYGDSYSVEVAYYRDMCVDTGKVTRQNASILLDYRGMKNETITLNTTLGQCIKLERSEIHSENDITLSKEFTPVLKLLDKNAKLEDSKLVKDKDFTDVKCKSKLYIDLVSDQDLNIWYKDWENEVGIK